MQNRSGPQIKHGSARASGAPSNTLEMSNQYSSSCPVHMREVERKMLHATGFGAHTPCVPLDP
jgi:hypothetical protein